MPLLILLSLAVTVACCVHVMKTGRPYYWLFILIATSWLGAAVYFLVEILPELRRTRAAREMTADVGKLVDPDRDYREAANRLAEAETVTTLTDMADQLVARERYDEAAALLERCLKGPHENDPETLIRLAEARFLGGRHDDALAALDRVQEHSPGYHSQPAHLIYARSLEELGRTAEALETYEALVAYASGEEARVRYALLLQKEGRTREARALFEAVVANVERASKVYFRAQKEWYQVARANL